MKIHLFASANQDLIDGYNFYEKQENGLGEYFIDSLFSDIDSLQIYAGIHVKHFGKYHRMLAKRFPYAIYYRVVDTDVFVYAILDCRRQPAWIRKHLEQH